MIQSFRDRDTRDLYEKGSSRRWAGIQVVARRKLDQIEAAINLSDLRLPPADRLEALKRDRVGQHSIRINDQYRICFVWKVDGAHEVEITDYHERTGVARVAINRPASGRNLQRVSTHPGEILRDEFLVPLGITQNALALKIRVPATRIGDIIHGKRAITPDTALRLARFFGNRPEFWLNLQQMHDLSNARLKLNKTIERDVEAYTGAR